MSRKTLTLCLLVSTFLTTLSLPAQAATIIKPAPPVVNGIPVLPLTSLLSPNLSASDDIASAITDAQGAYLIGTLETTTTTLVQTPSLGGTSDGYIAALGWDAGVRWGVRLGGAGDEIATSAVLDSLGNLWVIGASNIPNTPATPYPTPTNIFNPNNISITPTTPATTGLRRLLVWKVASQTGAVAASYSFDFTNVISPTAISIKSHTLTIQGLANDPAGANFSISMSSTGNFGHPTFLTLTQQKSSALTVAKSASFLWQSYVATGAIPGIPAFKPKSPTTILIKSSLKSGKILALYTLTGNLVKLSYQKSLGLFLITQTSSDYGISILKTP